MKHLTNKIKNFFENRSNRKLMMNYGVVLLLMIAFSSISFFTMGSFLINRFDANNELIVDTVAKSLNSVFKRIDDITKSLEEAEANNDIFSENGIIHADTSTKIKFSSQINNLVLNNDFVEEIAYMKKDQTNMITSQGTIDKAEFFEKKYNSEQYNLNFFNIISTDYYNIKVLPSSYYKNLVKYPSEDPKKLMVFIKSIPATDINILMFVLEDRFLNYANLQEIQNVFNLSIFDQSNEMIFSNSNEDYGIITSKASPDFNGEVKKESFQLRYFKKSGYNNFYYVAEIKNYVKMSILFSFIVLFIGILLSFLLILNRIAKANQPLKKVFEELSIDKDESYLEEIHESILLLKKEINVKDDRIDTMKQEIQNSLFAKLTHNSSYFTKHRKTVEMVFENIVDREKFLILSIEVIKENLYAPKFEIDSFQEKFSSLKIKQVTIEEQGNKYLFILGMYETTSSDFLCEEISKIAIDIRNRDIDILVSLSKEFNSLSGLYDAYADIKICRDYRGAEDKETLLQVKDIKYGSLIYLPLNFKDEFTSKMMAREEQALKDYCKNIFQVNLKNNIPIIKFEFLLRTMQNAMIEVLSTSKKEKSELFEMEQVFLSRINHMKEDYDIEGVINSFYNLLHLGIGMCDSKKNTLNRSDVIKYINSRYNEDLYLEKIASVFDTTSKYFSNYFKKEFSVGFNEYLTQIRISHAKKMLIETKLPLSEVGEKVGYFNQTTFAVAFKKNVGSPPGKYREMNKKEENNKKA